MVIARASVPAIFWLTVAVVATGCAKPQPYPAEGLRPLPLLMAKDSLGRQTQSLQPQLQWETFPRPEDVKSDKDGRLRTARAVTYDLRIWRADGEVFGTCPARCVPRSQAAHASGSVVCSRACVFPAELVYERKGLVEPAHTVESPLEPNQFYLWTVRARFEFGGQPRVTQWGALLSTDGHPRDMTIPSLGYYSFRTPNE
jgi:hypothetical protein